MKYRKKPVVIDAFEFCENFVPNWGISAYNDGVIYFDDKEECFIKTLEGDHHVSIGDYIIRGVNGELYTCKPDIFEKTYEAVLDSD